MSKQYIFDYRTGARGSDCVPDYFATQADAERDGLAFLREFVPDAVAWSIREVDEDTARACVVAGGTAP